MAVLGGIAGRRARNRITVQPARDCAVTEAVEVFREDPANNLCRRIVDCKYPQPIAFRGLPGVGMRAAVDHLVAVGRATALVATFVDDLSVHRGAHASLNMLALGLAHSAENAHQHLVRRITVLELAAQLGDPKVQTIRLEARCSQ